MNSNDLKTLKNKINWENAKNDEIVDFVHNIQDEIDKIQIETGNSLYQIRIQVLLCDICICSYKISTNRYRCKNVRTNIRKMFEICDKIETYL